jgi:hypothetical protein
VLAVARRYFATGGACTSWVALLARSSLHAVTQQRFTLFEAYHLIPIADALRRRGHANPIGFFLHVPMPPPEVLMSLPNHETLIPLLLQYDVAVVLRRQDFTALPGISIIVACLAINQLAYALAIRVKNDSGGNAEVRDTARGVVPLWPPIDNSIATEPTNYRRSLQEK